jgi:hypothetical protein
MFVAAHTVHETTTDNKHGRSAPHLCQNDLPGKVT